MSIFLKKKSYILFVAFIYIFMPANTQASLFLKDEWDCAAPKVSYSDVSIKTEYVHHLQKLKQMEQETIEIAPNSVRETIAFYNNLYGDMAEIFSRKWFDNAGFSSHGGKTIGNQGFDGLYTLHYDDRFVVVNEVKYNKSRLTSSYCKEENDCKCGQLSRSWVRDNAEKLVAKDHDKYCSINTAIKNNLYCRTLIQVDTEGYMWLFKIEDKECSSNSECTKLTENESNYFNFVKEKLNNL